MLVCSQAAKAMPPTAKGIREGSNPFKQAIFSVSPAVDKAAGIFLIKGLHKTYGLAEAKY